MTTGQIIAISTEQIEQQIAELERQYAETQRNGQSQLDAINADIAKLQQQGQAIAGETTGKMNNLRGQIDLLKQLAEKNGLPFVATGVNGSTMPVSDGVDAGESNA